MAIKTQPIWNRCLDKTDKRGKKKGGGTNLNLQFCCFWHHLSSPEDKQKKTLSLSQGASIWRTVSFQPRFTTVTCWHFISTYFLSANFALIFLVLTSSLQRRSSVVKRTVLTPCHPSERTAASHSSWRRRRRRRRSSWRRWKVRPHTSKHTRLWALWSSLSPCRAPFADQALHLVYLTSCVWHSVSASVSLSNTPSEVSLVCSRTPPASICWWRRRPMHRLGGNAAAVLVHVENGSFLCPAY